MLNFCEWYKNKIFGYNTLAVDKIKWNKAMKKSTLPNIEKPLNKG